MINYYEILNVNRNATDEEIKQAYRSMVKKYHPDINKSEEASKLIISLNEAKENLLDPDKRKQYDALLDDVLHSKEYSKDKNETHSTKNKEYKEAHSTTYVTRWQFFKEYLKYGTDKTFYKILKTVLVGLDVLFFTLVKWLTVAIFYVVQISSNLLDYVVVFLTLLGVLSLFAFANSATPDYISFIPANVELCLFYIIISLAIIILKIIIVKGSINLFVKFQSIQDRIFVSILTK